jgi:hypothetical protein
MHARTASPRTLSATVREYPGGEILSQGPLLRQGFLQDLTPGHSRDEDCPKALEEWPRMESA